MGVIQFYEGKTILITGATGFLGKVLIEKLLRSCPGIKNIYVILRSKRGQAIEERLEKIKESVIFDLLKKENPDALRKLIGIKGDLMELNLGLSDSDRQILVENVNIIFHSAASVRFDDILEKAIILNVRGTREISQLALDLKNPVILVHVSTAFSTEHNYVEEKLYPAAANWRDAIILAEKSDKELLKVMTEKYIYPYPNTYTFTKGLAEQLVTDMCAGKVLAIVTRPSIVTSVLDDPIPGWNDNFNGPIGLMTAGGKGLLRIGLGKYDCVLNDIPVDIVTKGTILACYNAAQKNDNREVEVYNMTQQVMKSLNHGQFIDMANEINLVYTFPNIIWYPRNSMTTCAFNFYIQVLLFHMLPAVFLDMLLKLYGKKPMIVQLQRKIYIANNLMKYYSLNEFIFINNKMIDMQKSLSDDEESFRYKELLNKKEIGQYMMNSMDGISKYLLKEEIDPTRQKELKALRRFWYADVALKTIFFSLLVWFLLIKLNLMEKFMITLNDYYQNL